MKKRKWKLMKNQNLDREPEMNQNQGKILVPEMQSRNETLVQSGRS